MDFRSFRAWAGKIDITVAAYVPAVAAHRRNLID
jgi:hypothetical protein